MGFWKESFLDKRRKEWMRDISKVQYYADGVWYDAQINEKVIQGDVLSIKFTTTDNQTLTITEIRLLDRDGVVAGSAKDTIVKSATQGVLYSIEVQINNTVANVTN